MTGLLDTNVALYLLGGRLAEPLPSGSYGLSVITEMELLAWPSLTPEEEQKIRVYARLGIPYYVIFDPKERLGHGLRGGRPDSVPVEVAHPAPGRHGRGLGGAHQFETEVGLGRPRRGKSARGGRGNLGFHALMILSDETAGFVSAFAAPSTPARTAAALTNSRNSGCGRFGRERNSG